MCRGVELSGEQVRCWYEHRVCEIEQLSGQVDGALQLVKLAVDKSVQVCSSYVSYAWTYLIHHKKPFFSKVRTAAAAEDIVLYLHCDPNKVVHQTHGDNFVNS